MLAHTKRSDALVVVHGVCGIKQHERRKIHPLAEINDSQVTERL